MQPRGAEKLLLREKIVFHGGIDTQELLPFMAEPDRRNSTHETIEILNRDRRLYIFAAARTNINRT